MISTKQAQALRLQCTHSLGMSEEQYKEMLQGYGVNSAKQLSSSLYSQLMQKLKGGARHSLWQPSADKQLGLILHLWGDLYRSGKVRNKTYSACLHWMRKYLLQDDGVIEFTPTQKSRCIERLKAWLERE